MGGVGESGHGKAPRYLAVRFAGLALAVLSAVGAGVVVAKLYTGRGSDTPIRSAMLEQPLVVFLGIAGVAIGLVLALFARQTVAARAWLNPRWVWRERRAEFVLLLAAGAIASLALEGTSRWLYARAAGLPFFYPLAYAVYPPLYTELQDYTPDATNVLLLGGSVLWGVGLHYEGDALCDGCRIYNLAQPAHSSLDSAVKYRYLIDRGYRFDYVVFYHGINETRANNVPPNLYSEDYNHYFFYRLVNTAFRGRSPIRKFALNSALVFRANQLVRQLSETRFFGRHGVNLSSPRDDWLRYGGDIKSAQAFERNVLDIAELAQAQDAKLIVVEFAYDPLLDRYVEGGPGARSRDEMVEYTEQWGLPEHVRAGIRAHNKVLARHATRYTYRGTDALRHSAYFIDPCHFTPEGEAAFVRVIHDALAAARDNGTQPGTH